MKSFSAKIIKIGINPYVLLPDELLQYLFKKAKKEKGPIPVRVVISKTEFIQNLVFYSGRWRLYLNGPMRVAAGRDVGEEIKIKIDFDSKKRKVDIHPVLEKALSKNKKAKTAFEKFPPSRKAEISKYLHHLKTEESVNRNIKKVMGFLTKDEKFLGREK